MTRYQPGDWVTFKTMCDFVTGLKGKGASVAEHEERRNG